jgi:predicted metal-dependent enzyme (double-stranded beta helix superfamily)
MLCKRRETDDLPTDVARMSGVSFEVEAFVAACRQASTGSDPSAAVRDVVAEAIADGPSIDAALGSDVQGMHDTLFVCPELTVQRIGWPAGNRSSPHEHRMWAVVGVYAGIEINVLYQRSARGLVEQSVRHLGRGEVLVLDEGAIHAVANPLRDRTVGLHVYGGDIAGISRNAWNADGSEVPFAEDSVQRRVMLGVIQDLAVERDQVVSHDDLYDAYSELCSAYERRRRYLSPDEARAVVTAAWDRSMH